MKNPALIGILRKAVFYAKQRRTWAKGNLKEAERCVRAAEKELRKWTVRPSHKKAK
jgi:hypothetical protein